MISLTPASLLFIFLYLTYAYIIHPLFFSPLSKIPSAHPTSHITSLWLSHIRRKGALNRTIHSLHLKRGPVIRLSPSYISANSTSTLRTVYVGGFEKPRWYGDNFANYGLPNLVTMMESKPHSVQKRMMANVYSKSYLQKSEDIKVISRVIIHDRLLKGLDQAATRGKDVDVLSLGQALGFDFTSAFLLGLQNGSNFVGNAKEHKQWQDWYAVYRKQNLKERSGGDIEKWGLKMCEAASQYP